MTSHDGLRSPKLKIERAKTHIRDLEAAVGRFFSSDFIKFSWIVDDPGPDKHLIAKAAFNPPDEIALLIGDAAHNLRTALDHLACCLAFLNGATSVDGVYFPITRLAKDFDGFAKKKTARLSAEAREMIYALKPHGGGNELFCTLNALDNADKHRTIVTTIAIGGFEEAYFTYDQPIRLNRDPVGRIDHGIHLLSVPKIANGQCDAKLLSRIEVAEIPGFEGRPIETALTEFVDLVEDVIEIFERRFF